MKNQLQRPCLCSTQRRVKWQPGLVLPSHKWSPRTLLGSNGQNKNWSWLVVHFRIHVQKGAQLFFRHSKPWLDINEATWHRDCGHGHPMSGPAWDPCLKREPQTHPGTSKPRSWMSERPRIKPNMTGESKLRQWKDACYNHKLAPSPIVIREASFSNWWKQTQRPTVKH